MNDRKMILRIRNGQSTLEYVLILAVVVGAIVAAGVIFKPDLKNVYNTIYNK
jgi:Flp pilus assembly pilin Flp